MTPLPETLDRLQELAAKATPGPYRTWLAYKKLPSHGSLVCATAPGHQVQTEYAGGTFPGADMDYFAALDPATVRYLIRMARAAVEAEKVIERVMDAESLVSSTYRRKYDIPDEARYGSAENPDRWAMLTPLLATLRAARGTP
jgi:hypothetical protein